MNILSRRLAVSVALALAGAVIVPGAQAALITISNGIYDVHIDNGSGSWNAITAAGNPTGAGHDLLYDGTTVSTNFSSLRIFSPTGGSTTYTASGSGGGTNWNGFITGAAGSTTYVPSGQGYLMTWNLGNGVQFTQEIAITGTNYANSAIYDTVTVTNSTNSAINIGWRNLYDWAVNDPGFDDGPSNAIQIGASTIVPTTTNEFSYTPAAGSYARVAAAPPPSGGATYEPLLGLGFDPGFIAALAVTMPTEYDYVSWPNSFGSAFDYTTTGANVTSDSAGLSWFGRDANSAVTIAAGGTVRFTQTIYAVPPDQQPPGSTVPEPMTLALLGLGLAGFGVRRKVKK